MAPADPRLAEDIGWARNHPNYMESRTPPQVTAAHPVRVYHMAIDDCRAGTEEPTGAVPQERHGPAEWSRVRA